MPAVCGAQRSNGKGPCKQRPTVGATRCRFHGSKQQLHGRPDLRKSAPRSQYIRNITPGAQEEIDRAISDPGLLDVRRTVALSEIVLGDAGVFPSEAVLEALGRKRWLASLSVAKIERMLEANLDAFTDVPQAFLELARRAYIERSLAMVEKHGKTQMAALRQVEVGRLMREQVTPMLMEMGLRVGRLIHHYVPEDKRDDFIRAFRNECRVVVTDLGALKDVRSNK